jgi:class 3 adenylate cyclase/tetratricopeptide (TPR) repeat protein
MIEGSFIFADVTGFTALTELLSRQQHNRGLETMNQIMNRLFSTVLDPLLASGGDLLFFVGDAVLIYFPKQADAADVLQAIRAALRMERAIQPFANMETEFGRYSLTMSAGVERGAAYAAVVGAAQRMELLVSGPVIYDAMMAEQQANPGQVALGQQALALATTHFTLQNNLVIDNLGPALGDYEIATPTRRTGGSAVMGLTVAETLQTLETTLRRVERLAPFLPEDILARLVNNERQRQLQPELRPVAVQFINLIGLEELATTHGAEFATQVFQRYFVRAQEIINRHEGVISQIDAYSQGFMLVNTFGAPRAHEGTSRYAIAAALQLDHLVEQLNRELTLDPPLRQRCGITHDLIFTGEIGAVYRRESVIAGPAVNRAARLMSKAQFGQIILDSDMWDKARSAFAGETLPPVTLKGIDGPVIIVNVRQVRRGTRLPPPDRPLLSRETDQARLEEALAALLKKPSNGGGWLITGETGLGKTQLVGHLADQARQRDLTVLVGRCQPHGQHLPLFPWLDLLTGWLDVNEKSTAEELYHRLAAELKVLDLSSEEKTLAGLLSLPAPDMIKDTLGSTNQNRSQESLFKSLDRKIKQEAVAPSPAGSLSALLQQRLVAPSADPTGSSLWTKLEERVSGPHAISQLIQKLAQQQPLVIILDDIDWIDRDSAALLDNLLAQLPGLPLLLVLTRREPVDLGPQVNSLALAPLPQIVLAQIAARTLGGQILDSTLAQWLGDRAGGNPLFVEELCQALRRAGAVMLDHETGEVRWTGLNPDLPLSLHSLLLARLDELALQPQEVLKRAAVIGVSFETNLLLNLCQPQISPADAQAALEAAVRAAFIAPGEVNIYHFNHPLLAETLYATLTFSQRQKWHTQIGDWLVEHQVEPDQFLELIAYHYLHGHDTDKAATFGLRAGDRGRTSGAYAGAVVFYSQVLALSGAEHSIKRSAAEGKADSLALQEDYAGAIAAYGQAIELGSSEARAKQAILSGDLAGLHRADFNLTLHPWAIGARVWLLAQQGQHEAVWQLLKPALETTDETARHALEMLAQTLNPPTPLEPYSTWLRQFTQAVLRK